MQEREKQKAERIKQLQDCFAALPDGTKILVENLIKDAVYWEFMIIELREFPQYIQHPRKPEIIKPSYASRQLERAQVQYNQIIKTLTMIHNRLGGSAEADLLDQMLNEYGNS